MAQVRRTARYRIGLAAACAALSLGGAAQSRQTTATTPAVTAQAQILAQQQVQERIMATALSDQPIDAAQLALGRRLTQAITLDRGMASVLDILLASMRDQVVASLPANAPPARKALFVAALDEALAGLKADTMAKLETGYSRYFAASMTPATLAELTRFYESPLGQKVAPRSAPLNEADTQAVGQYYMDHPALMEGIAAMVGGAMVSQEVMKREQGVMAKTFKVRLCQSLKTRGAAPASCAAAT